MGAVENGVSQGDIGAIPNIPFCSMLPSAMEARWKCEKERGGGCAAQAVARNLAGM